MRKTFLLLCTLFSLFSCAAAAVAADPKSDAPKSGDTKSDDAKPASKQVAAKLEKEVPVKLDYLLYLPEDYDAKDKWPLVIFLHGAGERGDDLERVKVHGPPKLIDEGKSLPAIVVSPQCATNRWWHAQLLELTALIDDIEAKYKVDKDRIYLTGLSMGGFGTWALGAYTPERFAALVPICGGGEALAARAIKDVPVWAFHGAKDPVVPLSRSETMVQALERAKGNVKFTVYPDAMHDSWTETYNNPELWTWLFEQKLPHKDAASDSK
jgi:predicted peptidase